MKLVSVFGREDQVDVGTFPKCSEAMEIMGAVQDPAEVHRYLCHVGMKKYPPPIAPARYVQAEWAYDDRAYEETFTE